MNNAETVERFAWERGDVDLPYYRGEPTGFSPAQWWLLCVLVVAGFAVLILPFPLFETPLGQFIPAIVFLALPIMGLRQLTPRHWQALFRAPGWSDLVWMLAFVLLNLVVSVAMGLLVRELWSVTENPAALELQRMDGPQRTLFLLKTLPQLMGEELFTIIPLLALLHWLHVKHGMARRAALLWAWGLSAIWFALAHLPTYDWHLAQCLLVIGSARLVLTWAFLKTHNLWVSTGAHVINDWSIFAVSMLAAGAASAE